MTEKERAQSNLALRERERKSKIYGALGVRDRMHGRALHLSNGFERMRSGPSLNCDGQQAVLSYIICN